MKVPLLFILLCLSVLLPQGNAANAPYVKNSIPPVSMPVSGTSLFFNPSNTFDIAGVTGTVVQIAMNIGSIFIEVYPDVAPLTVANFLKYVDNGRYDNTFLHRAIDDFVIQGGGYSLAPDTTQTPEMAYPHIAIYGKVQNEFQLSNLAGTIAMAKVDGNIDSATSEWFLNVADNTFLDGNNSQGVPQKFTVFGRILGNGLTDARAISKYQTLQTTEDPTTHVQSNLTTPARSEFIDVPYVTNNAGDAFLVAVNSVFKATLLKATPTGPGYLDIVCSSSDTGIAVIEYLSGQLKITPGARAGTATLTVQAKDIYSQMASTSFTATTIAPVIPVITPSYAVTVKASPTSYGTVKGAKTALAGTKITVKATPKSKHKFKKWTESGKTVSTKASYSFTLAKQRALVAVFAK